jgi:hypothetical protein
MGTGTVMQHGEHATMFSLDGGTKVVDGSREIQCIDGEVRVLEH